MGLKIRSACVIFLCYYLLNFPDVAYAQKKVGATKRPTASPAKPKIDERIVYKYLRSQVSRGLDCPEQKYSLTDWEKPLQFIPKTMNGKNVVVISGQFTAGDSVRLKSFLASTGPVSEIWLDSGGGNAAEGPLVGEVIRAARLKTRVAEGFACISSCSMAFLGGIVRQIDDNALYGLHTFYSDGALADLFSKNTANDIRNDFHKIERGNAILAGQIQIYGQKMGIRRDFFSKIMFAQRSKVVADDQTLSRMRIEMAQVMTNAKALEYVNLLASKSIIYLETKEDVANANSIMRFLMAPHSPQETDKVIGNMLQTFRCYPKNTLSYYNIINIGG